MVVSPIVALFVLLAVTLGVFAYSSIRRLARTRQLAALARRHGMLFSPRDRFGLAPHVAPCLPHPGAGTVRVRNLMWRSDQTDGHGHRFVFSVDYTLGSVGSRRNLTRVLAADDAPDPNGILQRVRVAPLDLTRLEQYQALLGPEPERP